MNIYEILKYWSLCELSDFETFRLPNKKIQDITYLEKLNDDTFLEQDSVINKSCFFEYYRYNEMDDTKYISNKKKTTIYKLYLGLIKVENFVKFLYEKTSNDIAKQYESEIERVKSDEYTYVGYVYLDYKGNLISIENKAIIINPIFYILKHFGQKAELNNFNYSLFLEDLNERFHEDYNIEKECINIVVPSFHYLMNEMKPQKTRNPFNFLEIENSKIVIFEELYDHLGELSEDMSYEYQEKASIFYDYLFEVKNNNDEPDERFVFLDRKSSEYIQDIEIHIFNNTTSLSLKNPSNIIYYITSKKNQIPDNFYIPQNMNVYEFFNQKEAFKIDFKTTSTNDINFLSIQKRVLEEFDIPYELLYQSKQESSLFVGKEYQNILLSDLKSKLENHLISFYIDALAEKPRKLTIDYIQGTTNRIDVNESIDNRKKINDLKYFQDTNGKWASKHPLYYAQQAAVNLFTSNYNSEGNIFSVNGPPGTGKTTLLKDIVANIIIKRTQNILNLDCNIFNGNDFQDDLVGKYEVIVTSNNNSAVENISVDLPKIDEFDFKYVESPKSQFLLTDLADEFYGYECWNLFSLKLGKSKNVKEFKTNFEVLVKRIKETDSLTNESILNSRLGVLKRQFSETLKSIRADEEEFKSFDELPILSTKLEKIEEQIIDLTRIVAFGQNEVSQIAIGIEDQQEKLLSVNKKEKSLVKRLGLKKENLSTFGFFAKYIFKRKEYKAIKDEIYQLNTDYSNALEKKLHCEEKIKDLSKSLNSKKLELDKLEQKHRDLSKQQTDLKINYSRLLAIYQNKEYYLPDDQYFNLDESQIQRDEKIYAKESYLKNKSILFLISLQISEVIVLKNIDKFQSSINNFLSIYRADNLLEKDITKLQKDFASLSFMFPVISTTLAASYTTLKNINEYGTLICDESGQATPQSLVGALNRANNALIVGDPLQVEPVFTVPELVINIYNDAFNIKPLYSPTTSSAQQLADNANKYGSFYKVQGENIWVGMPLVVHRRCLDPMFTIANKISYNEKMVSATTYENSIINELPESCWIDIVSNENDFKSNSSLKEKEVMEKFINQYSHILQDNYYIISPFKSINSIFPNKKNEDNNEDEKSETIHGTVHTFQGKESNVVFILLGGKKLGSKGWAAQKPNILNVALTRAKKKVYIIGDYEQWSSLSYFNVAANILKKIDSSEIISHLHFNDTVMEI